MHYSIIIITNSRTQLLENCLKSLDQVVGKDAEIIVVLNGPDAQTTKLLSQQALNLCQIDLKIKTTPADARNIAIKQAKGDWILFLDDDTEMPENYLSIADDFIHNYPHADVFGGPDTLHPHSNIIEQSWSLALRSPFLTAHTTRRHRSSLASPIPCDESSLILCALWFKASLFHQDGFSFDRDYFRNEENVLLHQLSLKGKAIYYHSHLQIIHRKRPTLKAALNGVSRSGYFRAKSIVQKQSNKGYLFLTPALSLLTAIFLAFFSYQWLVIALATYSTLVILSSIIYCKNNLQSFVTIALIHPLVHLFYALGTIRYFGQSLLMILSIVFSVITANAS